MRRRLERGLCGAREHFIPINIRESKPSISTLAKSTEARPLFTSCMGAFGLPAAKWLPPFEPSLVGADNFAVDVVPPVDPEVFHPCHQHLIMEHGIYLHEGLALDDIAATGRSEFAYVFEPLPIVGATDSPGAPFAML